ncbi:MAG: TIGR04283 family arsenosugar biosynthesis glycosyltransferase [Cyclobacteriaceae bacterium]
MISIVIPTFNEEKYIGKLLTFLRDHPEKHKFETIVADGGSQDSTLDIVSKFDCRLVESNKASRAIQMNHASKIAMGEILYFVHADVGLVPSFVQDIESTVAKGYKSGCYSCMFVDPKLAMLKINAWFTQFPFSWSRGGDQTLFITKAYFNELGGFDEAAVIMEDYVLIDQLLEGGSFKVLKKKVKISARKYKTNSYLKVQVANFRAMRMYKKGISSQQIKKYYESFLKS